MINAKKANALIWIGNVFLIIGIVAFAFQFLILPEARTPGVEPPISVPTGGLPQDPTDPQALAKLPNPLLPQVGPTPTDKPRGPIRLIGTVRFLDDLTSDIAYLELPTRKLNVNAYVGEPVRDDSTGVEVPELAGWKLKSVTPKSALFSTPNGDQTLHLEEITASPPSASGVQLPGSQAGLAWDPSKYATKKNAQRSNDNQEFWDIDRKEADWAVANIETILSGVSLEPYAGGGVKINALPDGGFAAERGFRAGDVIRTVNNQQVGNIQQLDAVMRGLPKNANTLTVQVDRSGRLYTLTYTAPRVGR